MQIHDELRSHLCGQRVGREPKRVRPAIDQSVVKCTHEVLCSSVARGRKTRLNTVPKSASEASTAEARTPGKPKCFRKYSNSLSTCSAEICLPAEVSVLSDLALSPPR